jgi:hypothetical protein
MYCIEHKPIGISLGGQFPPGGKTLRAGPQSLSFNVCVLLFGARGAGVVAFNTARFLKTKVRLRVGSLSGSKYVS